MARTFEVGGHTVEAIHVPGHTLGNMAFLLDGRFLFTGDSIFIESIARPDLGGHGDTWAPIHYASLRRLLELPDDTLVLPGHFAGMGEEGEDGKLRLPPTFSPELGVFEDCNFDLALLKWGCHTLLKASKRLKIDDPLIPRWEAVVEGLPDYPADEFGFRLGRDRTSSANHQHFSNLLMIYPLYLVNVDQEGTADVLRRSLKRALGTAGPGQRQAMVQAHAGPIATAIGLAILLGGWLGIRMMLNAPPDPDPGPEPAFSSADLNTLLQLEQASDVRDFIAALTPEEETLLAEYRREQETS